MRLRFLLAGVFALVTTSLAGAQEPPWSGIKASTTGAPPAGEQAGESPRSALDALEQHVLRSVVLCKTEHAWSYGFVYGDRRTVILDHFLPRGSMPVRVQTRDGTQVDVEIEDVGVHQAPFGGNLHVLRLAGDLPVEPLVASTLVPAAGERVYALHYTGEDDRPFEMFETLIQDVFRGSFTVSENAETAMPVVDANGGVLGVYTYVGRSTPADDVVRKTRKPVEPGPVRAQEILPTLAVRFGGQTGGWVEADHGAFLIDVDAGVRMIRDIYLLLRIGVGLHSGVHTLAITGKDGEGPGVVSGRATEVRLGLEAKYGFDLHGDSNTRLAFAAGAAFSWINYSPNGMAAFSATSQCDPLVEPCQTLFRDPDAYLEDLQKIGVGLSVGLDLSYGFFLFGYRFVPGAVSYQMENTHTFVAGFAL